MHPSTTKYIFIGFLAGLIVIGVFIIPLTIKWENAQFNPEDHWIDYEVVVKHDNLVILYNTNDVQDSIALRFEFGGEKLVGNDIIQVYNLRLNR